MQKMASGTGDSVVLVYCMDVPFRSEVECCAFVPVAVVSGACRLRDAACFSRRPPGGAVACLPPSCRRGR